MVCGKIRDPDSLARDLDVYADWLDQGQIARLVFSGWVEDEFHPLISRLLKMDARVVLAEPPVIRSNGHFYHQMKSLYYGLRECEDDELVLRSRTDKVWLNFDPREAAQRWHDAPLPEEPSPYARRIMTPAALVGQPFFFNDMMLLGLNGDLLKMVSFDLWPELDHALLNPEQQFHYQPYRRAGQFLSTAAFLRVNPGILVQDENLSRRVNRFLLRQEIYLRALAEGLSAFEQHYVMGFTQTDTFVPPEVRTLDDMYLQPLDDVTTQRLVLCQFSKSLVTKNAGGVSWMLDQRISQEDGRTLRQIALQPKPSRHVLEIEASELALAFARKFPDHPHGPLVPSDRGGGVKIVPARSPTVWI